MVARAAQGNPWIFREIAAVFEGKPIPVRPARREVVRMLLRHAQMLCALKGETIGIRQMRGHASWYLSGFPGAAKVRGRINKVNTLAELEQLICTIT